MMMMMYENCILHVIRERARLSYTMDFLRIFFRKTRKEEAAAAATVAKMNLMRINVTTIN